MGETPSKVQQNRNSINIYQKDRNNNYILSQEITSETEEQSRNSDYNSKLQYEQIMKESKQKEKKERIPVIFEWDSGGNCVYLTGSFCDWNQFYLMHKNEQGKFILILYLTRGKHQYKYKIDDKWKYNEKYPICNNNENINNYLDTLS